MDYDKKLVNRMKRIEGQIKGIINMMEEEKDCRDVVTQMTAVRSALDRTAALIVAENLKACILDERQANETEEDVIQEAVNLLVKSR
ncbi:MAG TPA: metal-sensitive transcriptional regulator [Pseudogracilibacillus sp.]|nr:metal-sensitive transcriptional regulator [Pseudogracilibacillus sp.]